MQFNNKIFLVSNELNEFGESTSGSEIDIKCTILEYALKREKDSASDFKRMVLTVMIPAKSFFPYTEILTDEQATYKYNNKPFIVSEIDVIRSGSGKPKYYELKLKENKVNNGD